MILTTFGHSLHILFSNETSDASNPSLSKTVSSFFIAWENKNETPYIRRIFQ